MKYWFKISIIFDKHNQYNWQKISKKELEYYSNLDLYKLINKARKKIFSDIYLHESISGTFSSFLIRMIDMAISYTSLLYTLNIHGVSSYRILVYRHERPEKLENFISDNGLFSGNKSFIKTVKDCKSEQEFIVPSMPERNSIIGRFLHTVKEKFLCNLKLLEEANKIIGNWSKFYNEERNYWALKRKTSIDVLRSATLGKQKMTVITLEGYYHI